MAFRRLVNSVGDLAGLVAVPRLPTLTPPARADRERERREQVRRGPPDRVVPEEAGQPGAEDRLTRDDLLPLPARKSDLVNGIRVPRQRRLSVTFRTVVLNPA
jgi:hypothetical protein